MPIQRLTIRPLNDRINSSRKMNVSFECDFSNEQLIDFLIIPDGVREELAKNYSEFLGIALDKLVYRESIEDVIEVEREVGLKLRYLPESVTIGFQEGDFISYLINETSETVTCKAYRQEHTVKTTAPKHQLSAHDKTEWPRV